MNLEMLEAKRLAVQAECDGQKQQLERNRLGQFATPPRLATEMLHYGVGLLETSEKVSFLDPAVGTGSFFSALLHAVNPQRVLRALGFEVDPLYAKPAKQLWTGLEVRIEDFTKAK